MAPAALTHALRPRTWQDAAPIALAPTSAVVADHVPAGPDGQRIRAVSSRYRAAGSRRSAIHTLDCSSNAA
jgi:hypothetical protein